MISIEHQQNILGKAFALVGHPKKQHPDLILLFYTGMLNELMESEKMRQYEESLDSFFKSDEEKPNEEKMLEMWDLFKQYGVEEEVSQSFLKYLHKYSERVRPALKEDKARQLNELLIEASNIKDS